MIYLRTTSWLLLAKEVCAWHGVGFLVSRLLPHSRHISIKRYPHTTLTKRWESPIDIGHEKQQQPPTQFVTCTSSREMARAVEKHLSPSDVVAELGSQLRDVSTEICKNLDGDGRAILVDVERKFPDPSKNKGEGRTRAMRLEGGEESQFFPEVATFLEIPNLQDWRKALFFSEESPDSYSALVLDVNAIVGNDLEWTFLSIVKEFLALNDAFGGHCRVVLVKSISLDRLASRLVHGQRWIGGNFGVCKAPHLVATVGVEEYRQTIPNAVQVGDAVLEVGCHLGTSTIALHEQASDGNTEKSGGYCIGVDVGSSIIEGAKKRYPNVYFAVGDAWRTADLLRLQQDYLSSRKDLVNRSTGFDVVYVDVGGLSGNDGLLEALALLSAIEHALEPRCIVIKKLGKPVTELFSVITPERNPAASLGQVYKATLATTGETVTVRVQRSGVLETVSLDLHLARELGVFARNFEFLVRRLNAVALLDELAYRLYPELDYNLECEKLT